MSVSNTATTESDQKRDAILAQAITTFAREGFRNADVQVIADRAGVGKGTVYRYFGNKEDLFWATTLAVSSRLEERLLEAMKGVDGALAQLRAVGRTYAEFFRDHPEYLEIFVQERAEFRGSAPESHVEHHRELIDRYAQVIDQGIAAGEIRPVDVRQAIVALGGLMYGAVVQACYVSIDHAVAGAVHYGLDIFLDGLRADSSTGGSPAQGTRT